MLNHPHGKQRADRTDLASLLRHLMKFSVSLLFTFPTVATSHCDRQSVPTRLKTTPEYISTVVVPVRLDVQRFQYRNEFV
jgi:hypothetical protein